MPKRSAGLMLSRLGVSGPEVLLVHPGGPVWAKRDRGAWSIPKGEVGEHEDLLAAALREFAEELGRAPPDGASIDLGEVRQAGGKIVRAFARWADFHADTIRSQRIDVEWPPRSGRRIQVPEVDRACWFGLDRARERIIPAQCAFLERLSAPPDH